MGAREQCRDLLRSPAIGAVNFVCQNVAVTPALFAMVANALDNNTDSRPIVGVLIEPALPLSVGASYRPAGNVFVFRDDRLSGDYDQVSVVHEAVHCGFDLRRLQGWAWFGQEACAYIAGALFAISAGIPKARIQGFNADYAAAYPIAEMLYRGKRRVTLGAAPLRDVSPRVSWGQYYPLRETLRTAALTPGTAYTGRPDRLTYNNDGASCHLTGIGGYLNRCIVE